MPVNPDALVAVLTLPWFFAASPQRVTATKLRAAENLQRDIKRKFREWLSTPRMQSPEIPLTPPQPFAELRDQVVEASAREADLLAAGLSGLADEEQKADVAPVVSAALGALLSGLPAAPTRVGQSGKLPDIKAAGWMRDWRTIAMPLSVPSDMLAGVLSMGQVSKLREVYPALYEIYADALTEAIVEHVAKNAEQDALPWAKMKQISVLLQSRLVPENLASLLVSNFQGAQEEGERATSSAVEGDPLEAGLTQTQKVEFNQ